MYTVQYKDSILYIHHYIHNSQYTHTHVTPISTSLSTALLPDPPGGMRGRGMYTGVFINNNKKSLPVNGLHLDAQLHEQFGHLISY